MTWYLCCPGCLFSSPPFFETMSFYVAQAGMKLTVTQAGLECDPSASASFPKAEVIGLCQQTQFPEPFLTSLSDSQGASFGDIMSSLTFPSVLCTFHSILGSWAQSQEMPHAELKTEAQGLLHCFLLG